MKKITIGLLVSAVICMSANMSQATNFLWGTTYNEVFTVDTTNGNVDILASYDQNYWASKGWDLGGRIDGIAQAPNEDLYILGLANRTVEGNLEEALDTGLGTANFIAQVNSDGDMITFADYRPGEFTADKHLGRGVGLEVSANNLLYTTEYECAGVFEIVLDESGNFQEYTHIGAIPAAGDGGMHSNVAIDPTTGEYYAIGAALDVEPGPDVSADEPHLLKQDAESTDLDTYNWSTVSNVFSWSEWGNSNVAFAQDGSLWAVNTRCEGDDTCFNLYGIDKVTGEATITWDLSSELNGVVIRDLGTYTGPLSESTPVPIPSTFILFGTGLAGLAAVGRRRRK